MAMHKLAEATVFHDITEIEIGFGTGKIVDGHSLGGGRLTRMRNHRHPDNRRKQPPWRPSPISNGLHTVLP